VTTKEPFTLKQAVQLETDPDLAERMKEGIANILVWRGKL
jgi:hypothetical protein